MPVDSPRTEYVAASTAWQRCRDCFNGSDAVKSKGTRYLPALASHVANPILYEEYLLRALFFNAMARTVDGLSGAIFQKPPTWKDAPSQMDEHFKDVSLRGQPLESFMLDTTREILKVGRHGILVDMSEQVQGFPPQPYWISYHAEDIIDWRVEYEKGEEILTQIRLKESYEEVSPKDPWVIETKTQIRVLSLEEKGYSSVVFRKSSENREDWVSQGDPVFPVRKGTNLPFIPFSFIGSTTISPRIEKPPLDDLAEVNLSHYRTMADLEHGRHYVSLPTPWVSGILGNQSGPLKIGAGEAWVLSENGKAGMLEFTGAGLGSLVMADQEKRKMMATLGAKLLEEQAGTAETATAVGMRHSGEHATLRTIAQSVEQGATKAAQFHAWWIGTEKWPTDTKVSVELNKEFFAIKASPDEIKAALLLVQDERISYQTFYNILAGGGWAREGVDFEEELEDIEADREYSEEMNPTPAPPPLGQMSEEGGEEETVVPPQGEVVAEGNPYRVEKRGNKFVVVKKDTGEVVGTHPTREKALAHLRALEANVSDA